MDLLIDKTYFYGNCAIPDKNEEGSNLERAMPQYQRMFLRKILGDHYYKLFDSDYLTDDETEPYKAIYGTEFEVDGKTYIYDGLVNKGENKSVIANYVFIKYQQERIRGNDSFGLSEANSSELSQKMPFIERVAELNREIEDIVYMLYDYIINSDSDFWDDFEYPYSNENSNSWQI